MRPVCVWLIGESGVGKTEMVYPLCIDLLRTMDVISKETDFHSQVYARQVETEYWDGYKSQKIVIYDDAFQMKDDKTKPNEELFEVIRSCNTFPQHLHMAALHDKNTFSAAEVLLYTTNNADVDIQSLTFPEAFDSRMYGFAYKVMPKREFAIIKNTPNGEVRLLDKGKLDRDQPIDLDIYEFQRVIKATGRDGQITENVGEPIGYDELSATLCEEWKKQKESSLKKLKCLEWYATRGAGLPMREYKIRAQIGDEFFEANETFGDDFFADYFARGYHAGLTYSQMVDRIQDDDDMFDAFCIYRSKNVENTKYSKYVDRMRLAMEDFFALHQGSGG